MKQARAIFLSHIINEKIPFYRGERALDLKRIKSIARGDSCNTMLWSFSNHTGTHMDTPAHFIDNAKSVSGLSAEELIFKRARLLRINGVKPGQVIGPADLNGLRDCDLLLIKTGFETHRRNKVYWRNPVSLSPELAPWLKDRCPKIRAVGIDSISVSSFNDRQMGRKTHKEFLSRNILLIEDMKLSNLNKDPGLVFIAPILVEDADASPCTILAIDN